MQRPVSWSMSVIPGLGRLGQEDSKLGTAGLHGEILSDEGLEIRLSGESTLPHEPELRTQVLSLSRSSILNTELQQGVDQIRMPCGSMESVWKFFNYCFHSYWGLNLGHCVH